VCPRSNARPPGPSRATVAGARGADPHAANECLRVRSNRMEDDRKKGSLRIISK
jgi:hypothetical protein